MALNAIAMLMSISIMMPVIEDIRETYVSHEWEFSNSKGVDDFLQNSTGSYRDYLFKYSEPELVAFFEKTYNHRSTEGTHVDYEKLKAQEISIFALLPAYALSEIKSAFKIGFYIYLPFIVIDLVVSNVLLALGMMMMSPVTVSTPIKLLLFVAMDGWALLAQGLVLQYLDIPVSILR